MIKELKNVLKYSLKKLGYVSYGDSCLNNPYLALVKSLNYLSINTIIDVGANVGQFAHEVYKEGFEGTIICFEPLKSSHQALELKVKNYTKTRPHINWLVAPPIALGDKIGPSEINICSRSSCSSINTMLSLHKEALPNAHFVGKESIEIKTLDSIWENYINETNKVLVKIDVQGYEHEVLKGADKSLAKIKAILIEVSINPLFEGQKDWLSIINYLEARGFKLWALNKAFVNEKNGRDLQYNALMVKE